ncbi:MAG: riboflavin synthase subunit beta [Flavobacteriaceae bacterium]|nr:riboflavin synthase subunit beta [Flavobacteriaceae bacterium]
MGALIRRKNKKFDYNPRYYKNKNEDGENINPYKIKGKFDDFRNTLGKSGGLKSRFRTAMDDLKKEQSRTSIKIIVITILILVLIFLFIIDFDLSIFSIKK